MKQLCNSDVFFEFLRVNFSWGVAISGNWIIEGTAYLNQRLTFSQRPKRWPYESLGAVSAGFAPMIKRTENVTPHSPLPAAIRKQK